MYNLKKIVLVIGLTGAVCSARENEDWLRDRTQWAVQTLLDGISSEGAAPGSIYAAPYNQTQNYRYHWVRDAALVIDALLSYRENSQSPSDQELILKKVMEWVYFTEKIQGLGTVAKVNLDGARLAQEWAQDQSDGPALTARVLIRLSNLVTFTDREKKVVYKYLDSTAKDWPNKTTDMWEVKRGHHFYNRMVQRRALHEGARFARADGKIEAADLYDQQASLIEKSLADFITEDGTIIPNLDDEFGDPNWSDLDIAVVLAFLHGLESNEKIDVQLKSGRTVELSLSSPLLTRYIQRLKLASQGIYRINSLPEVPGVAITRKPEDTYDGETSGLTAKGGNPWVLATLAAAEVHARRGEMKDAMEYLATVRYLGVESEQWDKHTGDPRGAHPLMWNCAALLTFNHALQ